ncbi:MAG: phytanoyl-CoA dioxygenase family protein [Candidatus Poribacteria bacterium]|nr:phytanoyl-CoA dioxygenase family protein [Candidatus Poribacteria bacterium]
MPALSRDEIEFFDENGYVVVRNAVPIPLCDAVVDAIWEFLGMDRDDPDDWYREPHQPGAGMVHMHQHPTMWETRQSPRAHEAFSQIWKTEHLWVSMDRVNMKPPQRPDKEAWNHPGFLHWDANVKELPLKSGTQGVLALTDTAPEQGAFQCAPGVHKMLLREENPVAPDLKEVEVIQVPANAGDLIIWNRATPHGNGPNTSDKPRLAQYINMYPAGDHNEEARERYVGYWWDREPAGWPGDKRRIEQEHGVTGKLSPLGRRLVGLDRWSDGERLKGWEHV